MKTKTTDKNKAVANRTAAPATGQTEAGQTGSSKEFEKTSSPQPNKKPAEKRLGDDPEIDDETTI